MTTITVDARYLRRPDVGIGVFLTSTVRDLLEAGAAVELVTDDLRHGEELGSQWPEASVTVLPSRSGMWFEQVLVRRHLHRTSPEIYLAPANWGLPTGFRGDTKLVLVMHDLIPLRLPRLYLMRRPAWAMKYLSSVWTAARVADEVVAVSSTTRDDVRRMLRRRSAVIYNRIPQFDAQAIRDGGDYFVYTGGYDSRKNVRCLLGAFATLVEAGDERRLVMTGTPPAELRTLISRLALGRRVQTTGRLSHSEVTELVSGAAALIYPSVLEGFGLPVVEGLSVGVPVVCGSGAAEAGGSVATTCDVSDVTALAAAMRRAATDEERHRTRREAPAHLRRLATASDHADLASYLATLAVCT